MSATQDFDTGPLNWVRHDIEAALKNAADRVRAYGTDNSLENALRLARDEIHLATGALRMVGLEGATKVATALEDALTGMDNKSIAADAINSKILLDALETLLKWVGRMADGRGEGELALFPAYRKLRSLAGIEQVFEGELFFPSLKAERQPGTQDINESELPQRTEAELTLRVKAARSEFQRGLLAFLRGIKSEAGLAAMHRALVEVEASVSAPATRAFWWACVGFVDALQNKGIEPDFNVKQLLARIDLQMRRLMEGSPQVAERLMRDALFFVATSKSLGTESKAVHAAFALEKYLPKQQYLDAEQLARVRPVLKSIKETLTESRNLWNAYSECKQDAGAGKAMAEKTMADFESAIGRLFTQAGALNIASLGGLISELHDTAFTMRRLDEAPRKAAQLEIATTLLFLQNAVENEDLLDPSFPSRAQSQIRRLGAARAGKAEIGATDLLDENTQKTAEHALFAQLGHEIGNSLQQIEEHLDTFFRDPDARDGLSSLSSLSAQVQGALAILDQSDAAQLLHSAVDSMRPYTLAGVPSDDEKTLVAEALSSLGLFVAAHCGGQENAVRILRPVQMAFGLIEHDVFDSEAQTVEDGLPGRKSAVAAAYLDWQENGTEARQKKCLAALTELGYDADLVADTQLKSATAAALKTLRELAQPDADLAAQVGALTGISIPAPATSETHAADSPAAEVAVTAAEQAAAEPVDAEIQPGSQAWSVEPISAAVPYMEAEPLETSSIESIAAEAVASEVADHEIEITQVENTGVENTGVENTEAETHAVDAELLDIFLEEAEEVLGNLSAATDACASNPDDRDSQVVIRRAFHTFKGSGRMVGLNEFGEAAWGMEQLMNGWLAAEKPAAAELLAVVRKAHTLFSDWVFALHEQDTAWVDYRPLLAEAVRVGHVAQEETPTIQPPQPITAPDEICIGDVCLSPGLFGVFKTESAQWARILEQEAERLAMSLPAQVSDVARRGVHTLAGIAGTTGFTPLSALSSATEAYLQRLGNRPLPNAATATVQAALMSICAMIDNIHGGNAPRSAGELIELLSGLSAEEVLAEDLAKQADIAEQTAETGVEASEATEPNIEASEATEPSVEASEIAPYIIEKQSLTTTDNLAETAEKTEQTAKQTTEDASLQEMIEQARKTTAPVFEQRNVQDELDTVLLPIFLEEAETLVPEAARALRNWKAAPNATDAPSALRRVLHTVKGSARMAGAMRLGELTHIMESRVVSVLEGQTQANAAVLEALEHEFDRMADAVDRLKVGSPEAQTTHVTTEVADADVIIPDIAGIAVETTGAPATTIAETQQTRDSTTLRVRADWLDRVVNQAGEVAIARSRIESEMFAVKRQVTELSEALRRLKDHLREVEIQAETQMQSTFQSQAGIEHFDPLEFDRFSRFQEVTRFMAESVHDVSTVHQNLAIQLGETDAALLQQSRINRELQQNLLRVRMVPLYSVSERLYRVVRQAARDAEKRAQLDIQGGDLEMDRGVLEKVVAPLEHLLRNAIAHGLETAEIRAATGKPEFGEVHLAARHEGNEMVLTIKDDGSGLNLDRIREKALAQGLLSTGVEPSENQLAQMIFVPGFTTAEEVTQLSGRGVGMDVVKNEIASLGGRIEISTIAGKGVTFTVYLPLTLAVTQAVIINAHKHEYALPATLVEQVQELKPDALDAAMHARAIEWRGNRYPLFYLPHLLGQPEASHEIQRYNAIVLMKSGVSRAAMLVDAIAGTREVVVKNIGPQLSRVSGIAGATVRGDGQVVLILNPVPLAIRALDSPLYDATQATPSAMPEPAIVQVPLVLVVDDSLTVRKITTRLMAREGYRVDTAKDGVDALEKMQDILPDVVLLDVEMPRMDGFELARVMRNDAKLKHIPIIMITSRTADKHRNHALEIGVNVYLGKPFQEAVLLGHIADLMGERAMIAL